MELIERHYVLQSWIGNTGAVKFEPDQTVSTELNFLTSSYDIQYFEFATHYDESYSVIGCFGFPKKVTDPIFYGFGSAKDNAKSVQKATSEAIQRLGFLWGEEIPHENPVASPTAYFHQEYFLNPKNHQIILDWLESSSSKKTSAEDIKYDPKKTSFYVLNQVKVEGSKYIVIKAKNETSIPLVFGKNNFYKSLNARCLGDVHPIV